MSQELKDLQDAINAQVEASRIQTKVELERIALEEARLAELIDLRALEEERVLQTKTVLDRLNFLIHVLEKNLLPHVEVENEILRLILEAQRYLITYMLKPNNTEIVDAANLLEVIKTIGKHDTNINSTRDTNIGEINAKD